MKLTVVLLLATLCAAQAPRAQFVVIHEKPRHSKRKLWTAFSVTAAVGAGLVWHFRDPQCRHYEGTQSGVNMPCPVEPQKGAAHR